MKRSTKNKGSRTVNSHHSIAVMSWSHKKKPEPIRSFFAGEFDTTTTSSTVDKGGVEKLNDAKLAPLLEPQSSLTNVAQIPPQESKEQSVDDRQKARPHRSTSSFEDDFELGSAHAVSVSRKRKTSERPFVDEFERPLEALSAAPSLVDDDVPAPVHAKKKRV